MTKEEARTHEEHEKRSKDIREVIGITEVQSLIEGEKEAKLERELRRQEVFYTKPRPKEQLNMRINPEDAFRLEYLAELFDHTRSSMGAALLGSALVDAWDAAELPSPYEPGTELHERFLAYFKEDEE